MTDVRASEARTARAPGRRRRPLVAAVLAIGMVVGAACAPGPAQPPTGPGSNTPCGRTDVRLTNPSVADAIYVSYPTGTAAVPTTGGTCGDASRPVLFLVHGYLANSNALYEGVINHFTRAGHIVVMGTYATDIANVQASADRALQAITAAVPQLEREDLSRVGLVGHSLGGGMLPWVTQQVVARGWGGSGLWMFSLAPYQRIGTGTITLPAHARAAVEAYDQDTLVNRAVGIDIHRSLSLPAARKDHITVRTSSHGGATLTAQHTSPNSLIAPEDGIKFFGIYRVGDLLSTCALRGTSCDADLSTMGTWPDGTPVLPSIVTDDPT